MKKLSDWYVKTINHAVNNPTFTVLIITIASFILCLLRIQEGHNWGGDFALYIHQAKSLVEGNLQLLFDQNKYSMDQSMVGPYFYPFGFPLIISPFYYLFGINLQLMKIVCAFFFVLAIPFVYFLSKRINSNENGILITIHIAFNWLFINYSDNVISDLPYFFFSTLSVYLITKSNNLRNSFLLGFSMFYAYFIRDIGITLIPTLFVYQYFDQKSKLFRASQLLPYITFFLLLFISKILLPFNGGANHFEFFYNFSILNSFENFLDYLSKIILLMVGTKGYWGLIFAPIIIAGLYFGIRKNYKSNLFILAYLAMNIGIITIWPSNQGWRFIFPLIPFVAYFLFSGLGEFPKKINWRMSERMLPITITTLVVLLSLIQIIKYSTKDSNEAYTEEMRNIYSYIEKEIPKDEVIGFHKPRVLRLFSDHNAIFIDNSNVESSSIDFILINNSSMTLSDSSDFDVFKKFDNYTLFKKLE